jgi:hypothetical protein
LKKRKAEQKPTHQTEPEKQSERESISETRWPSLSKSVEHERPEKTAEAKGRTRNGD